MRSSISSDRGGPPLRHHRRMTAPDPVQEAARVVLRVSLAAQQAALLGASTTVADARRRRPGAPGDEWRGVARDAERLVAHRLQVAIARASAALDEAVSDTGLARAAMDE